MGVQLNIPERYSAFFKYFRRNGSTIEYSRKIFCILQILQKKWECNVTVHHPFRAFKEVRESVRREVL
jgi:hypothetical protein